MADEMMEKEADTDIAVFSRLKVGDLFGLFVVACDQVVKTNGHTAPGAPRCAHFMRAVQKAVLVMAALGEVCAIEDAKAATWQ